MIDPELAPLVDLLPSDLGLDDPVAARQGFEAMLEGLNREVPPELGVRIEDRSVPGWEDDPAVPVRIYWPKEAAAGPVPGILMIHGGGFVVGNIDTEHVGAAMMAANVGALVVSVEYRLAPESAYPAAVHDCFAALRFLHDDAPALGVDRARIALVGTSAGGGLSAATALLARDRGGPAVCFQMLHIPELDDRLETPSMQTFVDSPIWNRPLAEKSWQYYLGDLAGSDDVPALRRALPRRRPLGPATRLRVHRRERPPARRGHPLRPAHAPGRCLGGAAPVPRHLPRFGHGRHGRGLEARPGGVHPGAPSRPGHGSQLIGDTRGPLSASPGGPAPPPRRPAAKGALVTPRMVARRSDGSASTRRADRHQSTQASDPVAKQVGPDVETDQEFEGVRRLVGGKQGGCGQVVDQHAADRGDDRPSPRRRGG